jgi:biotin transport system substrate-specific component
MSSVSASNRFPPLLASIVPIDGLLRTGLLAVLGSMVLAVSAKIQIPFWPVPMTMQSLVVLMLGMAYGSRLALGTLLLYLAEGAAGLPVFAGTNAGFAYMIGPTGGYLIGFVLAAVLIGCLAERGWDRSPLKALAAMTVGHVVVFVPGVAWLALLFGFDKAVMLGLTPFWGATLLKTLLGAALMQAAWYAIARRSQSTR